jgi:hypothetical protein
MSTEPAPINESEFRLDLRTEDDLVWRFKEADGEMGLRSNMGGFVALIERGLGGSSALRDCEPDGRAVEAARRARAIDQALAGAGQLVDVPVADLARLHFGERPRFGLFLPNLVEVVPPAAAAHRRCRSRRPLRAWLVRLGSKLDRGTAEREDLDTTAVLLRAAGTLLLEVGAAYNHARQGRPRRAA